MKAVNYKKVVPKPYFEINMGVSNREFYSTFSIIIDVLERFDEHDDPTQKCDHKGDLERIIVWHNDEIKTELAKEFNILGIEDKLNMDWHFVNSPMNGGF